MNSPNYSLSLAELIVYVLFLPFVVYLVYAHRRPFTLGYTFILLFLALQIVGAALSVHANPLPSVTGLIITGIGLTPQLLGLAGIVHEAALLADLLQTRHKKQMVLIAELVFHVGIVTAVPIYAVGLDGKYQIPPKQGADALSKAGILLLLLLWGVLLVTVTWASAKVMRAKPDGGRARDHVTLAMTAVAGTLALGVRVIYQVVATFSHDTKFSPVFGDTVYSGCLQFLPSAVVAVIVIVGGLLSRHAHVAGSSGGRREQGKNFDS